MKREYLEKFLKEFDSFLMHRQKAMIKNLPTFIGVGAGRCGTTSLYNYLKRHPEVYMSPVKELNYFGFRDDETNKFGMSFKEYLNYFLASESATEIGEISPMYLTLPNSAALIKRVLPDVKIIITLRQPIPRLVSQFKHHHKHHGIDDIDIYIKQGIKGLNDFENEKFKFDWFSPSKNLLQSLYSEGVADYITNFGMENIHIVNFDQLLKEPDLVLRNVCDFLNIEYHESPLPLENTSSQVGGLKVRISSELFSELENFFKPDLVALSRLGIEV